MNYTYKVVFENNNQPLAVLKKYPLNLSLNTKKAENELRKFLDVQIDNLSHTWGYFPELNPKKSDYKNSISLATNIFDNTIKLDKTLDNLNFQLAFVRLATSEPISRFGGLHFDVSAGIAHSWPSNFDRNKYEIFRTLFNTCSSPRKIMIAKTTRKEIDKQYSLTKYQLLDNLPTETIAIPPLNSHYIYSLQFIASQIPHAGVTDKKGHFLVSFGSYINRSDISSVFVQ